MDSISLGLRLICGRAVLFLFLLLFYVISPFGMGFRYNGGARSLSFQTGQWHGPGAFVMLHLNLVSGLFGGFINRQLTGNGIFNDGRLSAGLFLPFVGGLERLRGILRRGGIQLNRGCMLLEVFLGRSALGCFPLGSSFASLFLSKQAPGLFEDAVGLVETYVDQVDKLVNGGRGKLFYGFDAAVSEALGGYLVQRKTLANIGKGGFAARHNGFELSGGGASGFFSASDINMPADEFGGEPDVLPFLADRKGKLVFGHGYGQAFLFEAIDFDL